MKPKKRSPLILLLLVIISIGALLFICLLLNQLYMRMQPSQNGNSQGNGTTQGQTDNATVDGQTDGTTEPEVQDTYVTAAIKADQTIALYDIDGSEVVVNLDKRNWSNIRFSPDRKFISVLGNVDESKPDLKDIYVYDILKQSWIKATNFETALAGAMYPEWLSNSIIVFNQGLGVDNWLHTYNLDSEEIIKVKRYQGHVIKTYPSKSQIQFQVDQKKPIILDNKGEILWDLNEKITDADAAEIPISSFFYIPEVNKAYFSTNPLVPIFYKIAYQDSLAFNTNRVMYNVMCVFNDETALHTNQDSTQIMLTIISNNQSKVLKDLDSGQNINKEKLYCGKQNAFIPVQTIDKITWFKVNFDRINELTYLEGAKEVTE